MDGGKRIKGRKRFLLVDTLGLIWGLAVVAGNISEAAGARLVFGKVAATLPRWEVVWVDGGYEHRLEEWVEQHCSFRVEVIKRDENRKGWQLLPKRWVVERTFAWLGRCRRLSKDFEASGATEAAWLWLANIRLMLRRIARAQTESLLSARH